MPADGAIAVNPTTGERLEWRGGEQGGWSTPSIPFGKMNMPPVEPTVEQATQVAAQRQKETVQPPGGRSEGAATGFGDTVPRGVPVLGAAVPTTPASERFESEHPMGAGAAKMVGAGLSMLPLAATGPGAAAMGMSGPIIARPLISGASSAALGGADAAARGEDPVRGAMIGAVGGTAAPIIGGIIGKGIVQPIAEALGSKLHPPAGPLMGVDPVALKLARNAAKADGLSDAQIEAKLIELGPQGFLLDYGRNLQALAGGAASNSGTALTKIDSALGQRVGAARQTIDKSLNEAIGPDINVPEYTRFLRKTRKESSDPLYEQFRNLPVHPTDELKSLLPRLQASGAMDEAGHLMEIEGVPQLKKFFTAGPQKEYPTAEAWDYAKRGLDEVIERSKPWGSSPSPNKVRIYSDIKKELLGALDNHPDPNIGQLYREARQTYAEPSGIENALRDGQKWREVHKDELPYVMQNYSTLEKRAFMQGVRSDLDDMLTETSRGGTRVRDFFLAPANQEKLEALVGPEKAKTLVEEMGRQKRFADTKSRVADNSMTAARTNVTNEMKEASSNWVESALHRLGYSPHVTPLSYVPGMGTLKKSVGEETADKFKEVLSHIGNLSTTKNPEAANVAKALLEYVHPGETVGPETSNIINILARGAGQEGVKMKQGAAR